MKLSLLDKISILYQAMGRKVILIRPLRVAVVGIFSCTSLLLLSTYISHSVTWDINTALTYLDQSYTDFSVATEGI